MKMGWLEHRYVWGLGLLLGWSFLGCSRPEPMEDMTVASTGLAAGSEPVVFATTDWPMWRGPQNDGHAPDGELPITWSETESIAWSTDIPGRGHSSPVVCGEWVFLATALEATQEQQVLALSFHDGTIQWTQTVHTGGFPSTNQMHAKSTHANGTVACDGERIYAVFLNSDQIVATALSLQGKIVWQQVVGDFQSKFGYAPSPILYRNFLIVSADHRGAGYLAALDRKTGQIAWRKARPPRSSYSTARVAHVGGRDQLLISGCDQVASYDPATGAQLWTFAATTEATCGTIVATEDHVFASGGYPGKETVCLTADGSPQKVWSNRTKLYEPSLIIAQPWLFGISDNGVAHCWSLDDGEVQWEQRLDGNFSASPILANGHLYVSNLRGTTFVLNATGEGYQELSRNQLGDEIYASPAVSRGHLLIRAVHQDGERQERLYCIGPPLPPTETL